MNEASRPLLGPDYVGSRVVVRAIVPGETGPTGGPAFTDALGICTTWTEGVCEVTKASGEVVRIPLALIVSGKQVPPAPTRRRG